MAGADTDKTQPINQPIWRDTASGKHAVLRTLLEQWGNNAAPGDKVLLVEPHSQTTLERVMSEREIAEHVISTSIARGRELVNEVNRAQDDKNLSTSQVFTYVVSTARQIIAECERATNALEKLD